MNCPEEQDLSAFVDGELEEPEAVEIRRHIVTCDRCRTFAEEMNWVGERGRAALRSLPAEAPRTRGVTPLVSRPWWLAAAAVVVIGLILWAQWKGGSPDRTERNEVLAVPANQPNDAVAAKRAFAIWKTYHENLNIPRVPMEVAAQHEPPPPVKPIRGPL